MKLIRFERYVKGKSTRSGSSAEIIYVPDEKIAVSKQSVGLVAGQYELNTSPVILEEGERIYKKEKPYSEKASISDIKYIEADKTDVRQFLEDLKSQKTLQERIESTAEKIFPRDKEQE